MKRSPQPKTNTPSEETKHTQVFILQRRREGVSFPDIADELGRTQGYIYKLYKKALRDIIVEDVEEVRKLEMAKLEALEAEVYRLLHKTYAVVNSGTIVRDTVDGPDGRPLVDPETGKPITVRLEDSGPKLAALDRALKVMERRAKLLGLDKPTKIAPTDPDGDRPYVTIVAGPLDQAL